MGSEMCIRDRSEGMAVHSHFSAIAGVIVGMVTGGPERPVGAPDLEGQG